MLPRNGPDGNNGLTRGAFYFKYIFDHFPRDNCKEDIIRATPCCEEILHTLCRDVAMPKPIHRYDISPIFPKPVEDTCLRFVRGQTPKQSTSTMFPLVGIDTNGLRVAVADSDVLCSFFSLRIEQVRECRRLSDASTPLLITVRVSSSDGDGRSPKMNERARVEGRARGRGRGV